MRYFRFPTRLVIAGVALLGSVRGVAAQQWINAEEDPRTNQSIFRPIEMPDPTGVRNAGGMPGTDYWQQKVDYSIDAELDTLEQAIRGSERITYHNNSPDRLGYLWIQLDQNVRSIEHSRSYQVARALPPQMSPQARRFFARPQFDGGHNIHRVQLVDSDGDLVDAEYMIRGTEMRVNLLEPVEPGASVELEIDWDFRIPQFGRGAKELVSDGWLYEVAQWFPRLSVYDDINGWQTDQFLGQGEFYLEFGDYDVRITVPYSHIVDGTGILQNPQDVLTREQRSRLDRAMESTEPVFIIEPDEVQTRDTRPTNQGTLTWRFVAENVRDFAWVSSETYVWDAAGFRYEPGDDPIALHSLYPRDAMPLWDSVSTKAIAQTLETYGRMSLKYPYAKAVNVHGPVFGMEYPMIAFCGARPQPDGSYSTQLAHALISVTIHEVGHNWFPMIVASDERKWTWMDEGINTFLQYYAEQDWDSDYPSSRGPANQIVNYMRSENQVPLMTQSDLIQAQFGNNGYAKPAAGLVMLREQVLGPEAFDQAFREYSESWAFKHPQPFDFFRSIEEGAGEYLAWFWRGWFYTTYTNDQNLASVTVQDAQELMGDYERGRNYYRIQIDNEGGLVMPVQIELTYDDGRTRRINLPVDIWRRNELTFTHGFFDDGNVVKVVIDPDEVFADVDTENNTWEAATS